MRENNTSAWPFAEITDSEGLHIESFFGKQSINAAYNCSAPQNLAKQSSKCIAYKKGLSQAHEHSKRLWSATLMVVGPNFLHKLLESDPVRIMPTRGISSRVYTASSRRKVSGWNYTPALGGSPVSTRKNWQNRKSLAKAGLFMLEMLKNSTCLHTAYSNVSMIISPLHESANRWPSVTMLQTSTNAVYGKFSSKRISTESLSGSTL